MARPWGILPHSSHRNRSICRRSVVPWRPSMPLLLLGLLALLSSPTLAAINCVRFADYDSINQMFIDGGPGTKVLLCPHKTYRLSGTIVFTAADQELATYGYPSGAERATIRVESNGIATAIQGDCRRCARVSVRNLIVDGNRANLGRVIKQDDATGLIVLGGNEGQSVRDSWISDPRGFTAIHIREGDKLSCKGAVIERNEIGPVGDEFDPTVDGPDPELSPIGRPLADGISIACRDSFVRDNTIWDCTDAGVVVYCSPGTHVASNRISTLQTSAIAGILMVDAEPFDGDYSHVVVKSNILDAANRAMRVGIGIGASILSDDDETTLRGGTVISNGLQGQFMGFGIAASGIDGWTIEDNWSEARHQGKPSARCFDEPINPDPAAFLYNAATVDRSQIQDGFIDKEYAYIVCIDGLEDVSNPIIAAPEVAEPDVIEETTPPTTGSEVMDDILLHSQQRMLEAIDKLGKRVDMIAVSSNGFDGPSASSDGDIGSTLSRLEARLDMLESAQESLIQLAQSLHVSIKRHTESTFESAIWESDVLLHIQQEFYEIPSNGATKAEAKRSSSPPLPPAPSTPLASPAWVLIEFGDSWMPVATLLGVQIGFLLVVWILYRWWNSSSRRTKRL